MEPKCGCFLLLLRLAGDEDGGVRDPAQARELSKVTAPLENPNVSC